MARPLKIDDYVVHRIAEFIHIADAIHDNEEVRSALSRRGIEVVRADGEVLIIDGPIETALDETAQAVGRFICGEVGGKHLKRELRPQILRQLADALERKSARKRKSGKADDIAKIRAAWWKAKTNLKGLYRGDNPTFKEVDSEYYRLTGCHLDRRALKAAGDCPVRPDAKGKKLPQPATKKKAHASRDKKNDS